MNALKSLRKSVGELDADVAAKVISAASDLALVIDDKGVVRDVALANDEIPAEVPQSWLGKPWIDTVTIESRPKILEILKETGSRSPPRWRQVNHPFQSGADLPIRYSAVQVGRSGRILALGRDLRSMAVLQQRLVDAQQSMEREYARLRNAETRYRALFQLATEAVAIVDAVTLRVVEANPAATRLIGRISRRTAGRSFLDCFDPGSIAIVQSSLSSARSHGRAEDVEVRVADLDAPHLLSVSMFRQDNSTHFLARIVALDKAQLVEALPASQNVLKVVNGLPDGFVVTDAEHNILMANTSFLELAQLGTEEQAKGQQLDRWIGRSAAEFNLLVANLRDHNSIRRYATLLRGEYGSHEEVEISAVAVADAPTPCFGFTVSPVRRRPVEMNNSHAIELPRSANQLTGLVGRVPLRELVRESTDLIEKLCIEAALELTGDNRASAAEMLGLSRQSLYVKMRRFGLGDLTDDA